MGVILKNKAFLSVTAELKNLVKIRRFVEKVAAAYEVEPRAIADVQLAVDEAATNLMIHGYRGRAGQVEIEIWQEGPDLVVRLRDQAPPFDPTQVPPPDLTLPLEQRPIGGLGVHLMRQAMDELHYRTGPGGGNELTMVKRAVQAE